MPKQILPAELAEIVAGLLVQPTLLGELDLAATQRPRTKRVKCI